MTAHHPIPSEGRTGPSAAEPRGPRLYQIRVVGHLGARWTAWFDGMAITNEPAGTCLIRGPIVDQAALHGLLNKVRDIGLALESLTWVPPDGSAQTSFPDLDPTNVNTSGEPS